MNRYEKKKVHFENAHRAGEKPPAELDFAALAKEYGLSRGQTGPVSAREADRYDIGRSFVEGQKPFAEYAYSNVATYKATRSVDAEFKHGFLFWITDDVKECVPKFTDPGVRQLVIETWKMVHARKLAEDKAKALADEARKAGKSLAKAFASQPGLRVTQPEPFTWLTYGSALSMNSNYIPVLSQVEGIDQPGQALMQEVFGLQPGEIGVAFNQPKTVSYVIRVVEFTPPAKTLLTEFESYPVNQYLAAAAGDYQENLRTWLKELQSSAGLVWQRKADEQAQEQSPGSALRRPNHSTIQTEPFPVKWSVLGALPTLVVGKFSREKLRLEGIRGAAYRIIERPNDLCMLYAELSDRALHGWKCSILGSFRKPCWSRIETPERRSSVKTAHTAITSIMSPSLKELFVSRVAWRFFVRTACAKVR